MPDVVEILVTAKNLAAPAFAEVKAGASGMESSMQKLGKVSAVAGAAVIGFVGESIKMASDFDAKMTLLQTQAGVSHEKIAGLRQGVLDLAGQVGFSPDSLAESLYHVESNAESMGITSQKALEITKVAAEGAAVGHAKLVDVTNALTAAVASGIPGVQDMSQAMGVLNATVGVGDMSMQDLASAFGSGMVATVKGFGLSIKDVGAALAVFGDNNIRGSVAGTQLRMTVQSLAQPAAGGADALKRLGLTSQTLADDMQKGGLKLALEDLMERMQKAGITADQQGEIITQAFGKKAGAGLNVLLSQMDRFESKYPALEEGANKFGQAWADTQKTFSQQMKEMDASLQALMISFGEKLLPTLQKATSYFLAHRDVLLKVAEAVGGAVVALAGFNILTKTIAMFQGLGTMLGIVNGSLLAFKARVVEAQITSGAAGGSISVLAAAFSELNTATKLSLAAGAIAVFVLAMSKLSDVGRTAPPNIDKMTSSLVELAKTGKSSGELAQGLGSDLGKLGEAVDHLSGKASGMDKVVSALSFGSVDPKKLGAAKQQIDGIDQALAGLVQGGRADLAALAVKKLEDAMAAQGKDPALLDKQFQKYGDALRGVKTQNDLAAESMGVLGTQAVETSKYLQDQTDTAEGLKEAIINLNDANRAALDGMAGFEQAIADATKAAQDNGRSLHMQNGELDLTTQKARDNEKALSDLAAKTDAAAESALKSGESQETANKIYDRGKQKLIELAESMGLSKDEAAALADQILATPDKTAHLKADESDLQQKIADAYNRLADLPPSQRVKLEGDIAELERQLAAARAEIDRTTRDRVVNITASFQSRFLDAGQANAHGGIIGAMGTAASGGARGGLTLVGEMGPEVVRLPFGSTVYPAGQSRSMVQTAAASGAAKVQIEWVGGNAGDEFMAWLRKNIRIRGGDVQAVLGQ